MISILLSFLYVNVLWVPSEKDKVLNVDQNIETVNILPFIEILENDIHDIQEIQNHSNEFQPVPDLELNNKAPVHWLKFRLHNISEQSLNFKLSTIFSDEVTFFLHNGSNINNLQNTGDLTPFRSRSVKLGQLVLLNINVPESTYSTCYIRIESKTPLSQQFRHMTLKSLTLYSNTAYVQRFSQPRIYQG